MTEEVVWKYTFRPIYNCFTIEKCIKNPTRDRCLRAVKPRCGYIDCSPREGVVRHNSLWLKDRDDKKGAEILRYFYKERAIDPKTKPIDAQKFVDRIAYISEERAIVYAD